MIDRSFSKTRGSFNYGKYELQVFYLFVVISVVLAATMAVSSADPISTKARITRSPLPTLFEQAIATEQYSSADLSHFFGANASQMATRSLQGGK